MTPIYGMTEIHEEEVTHPVRIHGMTEALNPDDMSDRRAPEVIATLAGSEMPRSIGRRIGARLRERPFRTAMMALASGVLVAMIRGWQLSTRRQATAKRLLRL